MKSQSVYAEEFGEVVDAERWHEVEKLYHAALRKQPSERGAFLDEANEDEEVRREVASLLAQSSSGGLLDEPAWKAVASTPDVTQTAVKSGEERFTAGTVLARRYRILTLLGRGGMGEVYRATDMTLGQTVALKFLPQSLTNDASALNRLYNEVRLARQISHNNVCRMFDIAEADEVRFITMEYVEGEDLSSLLRRIGRLPAEKATEIAYSLCAGLAAAHDRGVLHRDLKPANIMLDSQGRVRITDFGLAALLDRLDARDIGSGTPAYMAPEQLAGSEVTIRSDIYSLGLVLYELFGGQNPFKSCSGNELLRFKHDMRPVELATGINVDPQIEHAIMHCLDPDPRKRPPSAAAVAVELSSGDPLAALIAFDQTPVPDLVACAGTTQGLNIRIAVTCLAITIAALVAFAFLGPRISILSRIPLEHPDALERAARDTLSRLGVHEHVRHRVARFAFDLEAMRNHFDAAALYFWYRASPDWMIPNDLTGVMSLGNPPAELPGMITTKWDGAGRLLYLKAVPIADSKARMTPLDLWPRLFAAAGLQLAEFTPAEFGWIPAPVGIHRPRGPGHTQMPIEPPSV